MPRRCREVIPATHTTEPHFDFGGTMEKAFFHTYFHVKWGHGFLFTVVKDERICLICHQAVALAKRVKVERHTLSSKKVDKLKFVLKAQWSLFTKPTAKSKAVIEASFRVSHLLAKHNKSFTDGELSKEAMAVAAETLSKELKSKDVKNANWSSHFDRRVESLLEAVLPTNFQGNLLKAVQSDPIDTGYWIGNHFLKNYIPQISHFLV
uniref:Uncharacterized protein n=1 Tax=Oncorhynchus tshawytscha TaxID=74940 RepID=A0A8C8K603_ONCTS